ncbi:MAG: T9SS type A sorting domain-containing protein [Bacteroidetes bacterium]|nr:T9SS type A sorting domain-containing protein [Bacteroidota bacterium]
MILQRFFFVLSVFVHSIFVSYGQDKPPVAVDDTAFILVTSEPVMNDINIYPLLNDYSQDMHPIELIACSYPIIGDSAISISGLLWFEENDTLTYYIRDTINGLISDPGYIFLIAMPKSYDMLNINNINARINATSHHFSKYIYYQGGPPAFFECPKFSNIYTFADFNLWLAGLDETEKLHLAPFYRPNYPHPDHTYRSGPISSSDNSHFKETWDRVWTLYRSDIENHNANFQDPGYEIPEALLNWPGNGDTTIGQAWKLAPFNDLDQDGLYEPLEGDYPIIKGDQAIYFISNDDHGAHSADSLYFGVEIHGMAYAYDCPDDSIFQNTMFIEYMLINRSLHQYHDVFVGVYSWLGIGSYYDNYTACDTLLDAFYGCNSDNLDSGYYSGYGYFPPAQAVTLLNQSLSHFITYFWRYTWPIKGPSNPSEYYNSLQGKWNDGSPITLGGYGYGGDKTCAFQFPGDPVNPDEWSMYSAQLNPENMTYSLGSTGPFVMNPGDTISLELAIIFARDYGGDNLSSVTLLKDRLKKLRAYYFTDSIPCNIGIDIDENKNKFEHTILLYPNPADKTIFFKSDYPIYKIEIYDIRGRIMKQSNSISSNNSINISDLADGIYFYRIVDSNFRSFTGKFVKNGPD